jgi:hypothetical protein
MDVSYWPLADLIGQGASGPLTQLADMIAAFGSGLLMTHSGPPLVRTLINVGVRPRGTPPNAG